MPRKLENWLMSLAEYVEDTESPRNFWLWAGIFAIAASLQRKVWIPYGMKPIYPNLYVMIVAPPAICRKSVPTNFIYDILSDIEIDIYADSGSKRHLTQHMDSLCKTSFFRYKNKPIVHCSTTVVSGELSSFLAVDPKGVIEFLTDAYDAKDKFKYGTSGKGEDYLYGICPNCWFATTPRWMAENLPEGAIGGGWTSRVLIVSGSSKYKLVPRPPVPNKKLYRLLKLDLQKISETIGEFSWGEGAESHFDEWYLGLPDLLKKTRDDRLHSFIGRMHIMAIKTAMCMHLAYDEKLVVTLDDMGRAIDLVEAVLETASDALSGHGRSRTSADVDRVIRQLRVLGKCSLSELIKMNLHDLNLPEMIVVLETIEASRVIKIKRHTDSWGKEQIEEVKWIGGAAKGKGGRKNINPMREKETKDDSSKSKENQDAA